MADESIMLNAKATYRTLCDMFEKIGWKCQKNDERMIVECRVSGDDLPFDVKMIVDEDIEQVILLSPMPFKIAEDKRIDLALAVSFVNNRLVNGCFDYDFCDGGIFFRISACFDGCKLSVDALEYLLRCACGTIDDYNDKFLMISKGMLSLEDFMKKENN